MLTELKRTLNIFLSTYPMAGKEVIDIYNDFITATDSHVPMNELSEFLKFIDDVKDIEIGLIITSAMADGLIPQISGQISETI